MSVEQIEILRKKARNCILIGIIITIIITTISLIFLKYFLLFFILIIGVIVTILLSRKPIKEFNTAFKNTFVLKSLQSIFTDLVYKPEEGLNESIIRNTQMMNMGDRYSSNDFISGKYKSINVLQADVHIEEEHETTDSDGSTTTTWVTIFKGRWMVFDFNKSFKANIQICQKGFGNNRVNTLFTKNKFMKVRMEDQDFNNKFRVFAQNEHDAFYVITPSLMERIKKLSSNIKGKLLFCLIDNKLHVGIYDNKDSFEHSIFKKINEEEVMNKVSQDIKLITNFVDELNLDNDLFRKEA